MREPLSQRLLAIELRTTIDRAVRRPWDTNARRRAIELAATHPRGMRSAHVRHNVKAYRLAWLAHARAMSGDSEAASLAGKEQDGS